MVDFIRSDLQFILEQIKIAEAHAGGALLFGPGGLIPTYNLSFGLRTVDGSFNHLLPGQERWGASNVPFPTLLDPTYRPASAVIDMNGPAPGGLTASTYAPSNVASSIVVDSSLRVISNLLVDQTLANPAAILEGLTRAGSADPFADLPAVTAIYQAFKPAFAAEYQARVVRTNAQTAATAADDGLPGTTAAEAAANAALAAATAAHAVTVTNLDTARGIRDAALTPFGLTMDGDNVHLPNVSPDAGLSAPFNSWFTLFGQFFDHGLDLVNKGGSGTVFVPLQPDDPLYVPGSQTNFMVLTRATVSAGVDGVMGTADDVRPVNTTTSYVDQNQTYASHASHQVFLRQYALNSEGRPVATGKLIEGGGAAPGGMATWGELKAQALMLGILVTDQDVGRVPLLRTDAYGNFIPNISGYAQVITGIGADGIPNTADDIVISGTPGSPVGLATAIRTDSAFLADIAHTAVPNGLQDGDIEIGLANPGNNPLVYDDELLNAHFVAGDGRVNENIGLTAVHHIFHSEHNRLVEHTKEVLLADAQAMIADGSTPAQAVAFLNEWLIVDVATVPASAAAIAALVWDGERLFQAAKFGTEMQYQHLVFEEFARKIQPQVDGFIVPDGFDTTINPDIVAEFAHVVYRFGHSMLTESIARFDPTFTDEDISLIDGFLNPIAFDGGQLIGDGLAAGDIVRGMTRQVGNEIDEFVTSALRNNLLGLPLDLATINLARGRDTGVPSLNAARVEFYAATNNDIRLKPYDSWVDFAANLKNEASIINFVAAYGTHSLITSQATAEGKRDAALTIITGVSTGGLAVPADASAFLNATGAYAGGNLGGLNNVDLWIGGLAEKILPFGGMLGSTFNFVFEVQMEQLQNGDRFYYLQRLDGLHLFGELEGNSFASMIMRNTDATHLPSDVFSTPGLILEVDPTKQFNDLDGNGTLEGGDPVVGGLLSQLVVRNNPATAGTDTNYLRYTGDQHVVLGGTENADILVASEGDDTLHGDGGNDRLEGGAGNDIINAGAGDDIVNDLGGDDNIKLGDGNDVVNSGPGLDLILGGRGQDFVVLGSDAGSEVFAGEGNDFVLGNITAERILGNEGDDWIEHGTFDGAPGDNFDEIFAKDGIDGHDVFFGLGGFDEYIAEGGDDIMVGSPGRGRMAGMSGWDWATYKDNPAGVLADLTRAIVFDENPTPPANSALDSYEAVEGLSGSAFDDTLVGSNILAAARAHFDLGGTEGYRGSALDAAGIARIAGLGAILGAGVTSFIAGDIILGGDGNDVIQGNAGNDIIDGDKWLNVRISVRANSDGTGAEIATVDSMSDLVTQMFTGVYNPGQLVIVREILMADNAGDIDTAVFTDLQANYDVINNPDGTTTVIHARGTLLDGTDTLHNIERLRFSDSEFLSPGAPVISDQTPTEGQQLTLVTSSITDPQGLGTFSYQWQSSTNGTTWINIGGATTANFTPDNNLLTSFGDQAGLLLRVGISFTDGLGNAETRTSLATGPVGVDWDGNAAVNNTFNGTAGNDIADGVSPSPGGGADTLNGNAGDDILRGAGGADTLNGGAGDDNLTGGAGADTINGNAGLDTINYVVGDGGDTINGGADADTLAITASAGADTLNAVFNGTALSQIGTAGSIAAIETVTADLGAGANSLVYGAGSAAVSIDLGAGIASGFTSIANIQDASGGGGNDTVTGNAGNNVLRGNGGADRVNGAAGDDALFGDAGGDTLDGGDGVDVMTGGAGDDYYRVDNAADQVIEIASGGFDTVFSAVSFTLLPGASIEALRASDALSIAALAFAGNASNQILAGNAGANVLFGGGGDDYLEGRAGIDVLDGGTGNDIMIGGEDDDYGFVDSASDRMIETAGQGFDTVFATANFALEAGSEVEAIRALDALSVAALNFSGNELNQILAGTAGANVLNGGGGDDYLEARGGNDTLDGGTGADVMRGGTGDDYGLADNAGDRMIEALGEGYDTLFSSDTFFLEEGSEVEALRARDPDGGAAVDLTGNAFGQVLAGNAGTNHLDGGGGDDYLQARGGLDRVAGGAGNDAIVQLSTDGRDIIDGGSGTDTYVLYGVAGAETFNIYTRAAWLALGGNSAAQLSDNSEIIVASGLTNDSIIAELDNIEEITVNALDVSANNGDGIANGGSAAGDTINVVGNYNETSLDFSTITINGGSDDETVNIEDLTSDHRVVFNAGTGHDNVIGDIRPQDSIKIHGWAVEEDVNPFSLARDLIPSASVMDFDLAGLAMDQRGRMFEMRLEPFDYLIG